MKVRIEFYDREANLCHTAEVELENVADAVTATNCQSDGGCSRDGRFVVKLLVPDEKSNS